MGRTIRLELRSPVRNKQEWVLVGIPDTVDEPRFDARGKYLGWIPVTRLDTVLYDAGMYLDTDDAQSVAASVYEALYDYHQCSNTLHDGDVIESEACVVRKRHSHRTDAPTFPVPAMRFRVISFHVVQE